MACLILILTADYLAPAAATANRQEDTHETHRATADGRICELLRPDRALELSGFGSSLEPVDWQLAGQTSEISRFIPATAPADPGDEYWAALGLGNGIDHYVFALATDDAGNLYAGGRFTSAGGASVNHIAKWHGTAWSRLVSGMNNFVYALAVDDAGNLYAGGHFTMAGGISANHVAKWDARTSSWSPMGNGIDCDHCYVRALAVDRVNGPIYAGGDFYGTGLGHVAKWDGTAWSSLGSGVWGVEYPMVFALAVDRAGNLYVGGVFTYASGVRANYIARWDGTVWSPLGSGMNDIVYALALDDAGNLYAGGHFTMAGGISANGVAKWDGTAWSPMSSGIGHPYYPEIHALAFDTTGNLYAGGVFDTAGGSSANYIAKWDGGSWSALGSGMNNQVHALAVAHGGLAVYAGGEFIRAGGKPSSYIAQWTPVCCRRYLPLIFRR